MSYPRRARLGDAGDCDPDVDVCEGYNVPGDDTDTTTSPPPGGTQLTTLPPGSPGTQPSIFSTILTDVSQFFHPGTPSTVPLYTPGSTAATQLLSNPLVLLGLGLAGYLLVSGRRR